MGLKFWGCGYIFWIDMKVLLLSYGMDIIILVLFLVKRKINFLTSLFIIRIKKFLNEPLKVCIAIFY